ncbi:lysine N(6)-hydroxylase/L-ornithine N(5)-oxygenase family protein [Pseudonocardia asaccharolytica]|uniref:L-lysine N6-monooxygenase MbtG n=1 Tax=Pseudonocardia asaccharolytica DSM 44247 = NBRC 16224 TaxID=1123024 RepID=A0A511D878_9PSEU|nr:lysine N(6)-hydroxylase/L-ornithine N(5)-oxygenase family protein [Pseudonocardia asaccharolytica]GEL20827.1 lysine/ornithine N-monooxygenase [Pseudonocardia asaccharolytica DSM 44247 = NBRC 16224]
MSVTTRAASPIHDLIGVGFGPSNLALAIAVAEEEPADAGTGSALFLERQPRFGWHRGMLIDDATMQVSFLKDLVTLRNPASRFSFLSYLHSRGRLVDFINHKNLFPLRVEFHDYLEWAAAQVGDLVRYGHEVVGVRPVTLRGTVEGFEVTTRGPDDQLTSHRARNVVFGLGLRPKLPDGVSAGPRIWHNRDLLRSVDGLGATRPSRFVVVGAGQSAAEVTAFLHRSFPETEVCSVFARYGYSPADDSSFANRIFDPEAVDHFFAAPEHVKQMMVDYHANTNYSVVDIDLIQDLYRRVYQEKVLGHERLRLFPASRLASVVADADSVAVTVESLTTGEVTRLDADVVVYATGYRPADPLTLLGELGAACHRDDQGRLRVERDYRVVTEPEVRGGIYLQGGTEHTHGLSSSLLSNAAVRAAEILRSIFANRRRALPMSRDSLTPAV